MTKTLTVGDKVQVLPTHWDRSMHGQTVRVVRMGTSFEGQPTCYVKCDGRSEYVHAADLAAASA